MIPARDADAVSFADDPRRTLREPDRDDVPVRASSCTTEVAIEGVWIRS